MLLSAAVALLGGCCPLLAQAYTARTAGHTGRVVVIGQLIKRVERGQVDVALSVPSVVEHHCMRGGAGSGHAGRLPAHCARGTLLPAQQVAPFSLQDWGHPSTSPSSTFHTPLAARSCSTCCSSSAVPSWELIM